MIYFLLGYIIVVQFSEYHQLLGDLFPDLLPGLCTWTPVGDFHPPDSLTNSLLNSRICPCDPSLNSTPEGRALLLLL